MAIRWCDVPPGERDAKQQKVALWSYYMTFYNTTHGRECLADLRRIVEEHKSQTNRNAEYCLAIDDLLKLIRANAGVQGEYVVVEAEQKIAVLSVPEDGRPEIEGFEDYR